MGTGTPVVTAPSPWSRVPVPPEKTAVSVVAEPAVRRVWPALKLLMVGAAGPGLLDPPPPPQAKDAARMMQLRSLSKVMETPRALVFEA